MRLFCAVSQETQPSISTAHNITRLLSGIEHKDLAAPGMFALAHRHGEPRRRTRGHRVPGYANALVVIGNKYLDDFEPMMS
jgi:hypothetical protein